MNDHGSRLFAPFGCAEIWTSFINHEVIDSHDQAGRVPLADRPPTPNPTQTPSSYAPSLPSYEDSTTLSSSSEDRLASSKPEISPSNTNRCAKPSHRRYAACLPENTMIIADRSARRRQQNRKSQRAFRNRKEAHQKDLEDQIGSMKQRHGKLFDSLIAKCKIISRLRATMNDLQVQIIFLQADLSHALSLVDFSQDESESSTDSPLTTLRMGSSTE